MAKELIAFYKKGDQVHERGRKDGHLINYIYEENATKKAGVMDHKAFACVQHSIDFLPELQKGVNSIGVDSDGIGISDMRKYSRASMKIDYEKLQNKVGDTELISKLQEKGYSLPVVNGTELTKEDYRDPLLTSPSVIDNNLITSGDYLIAGSTPDYAAFSNFTADFGATITTLTGQVDGAFTDNSNAQFNETISSGGLLTFTSNSDHLGVPTGGYLISANVAGSYLDARIQGNSGQLNLVIETLNIKKINGAAVQGAILTALNNAFTAEIRNVLIDCNNQRGSGIYIFDADPIINVFNAKIWDTSLTANDSGFYLTGGNASNKYQNISVYDCYHGILNFNRAAEYRNVVCHGNTNNWVQMTNATTVNCGTGGAGAIGATSETGTINSVVDGSYQSVDDTNAAFLIPAISGILDQTGTASGLLANNTAGIEGNPRPNGASLASVGANEFLLAGGPGKLINQRTPVKALVGGFLT